jgi:hypothetical protein
MTAPNVPTLGAYEATLDRLISDEELARGRSDELRMMLASAEARIAEIARAVDAMLDIIPPERQDSYTKRLAAIRPPNRGTRGTTAYEGVLEVFRRYPGREWSAPQLQDELTRIGVPVEIEQIHNVLTYLAKKGRVHRRLRGRYVPLGSGIIPAPTELSAEPALNIAKGN